MYEKEKRAVIDTALKIKEYGLIALAGGNVSMRLECGDILVTPSGTYYETMRNGGCIADGYRRQYKGRKITAFC